jgi:hypothetical protein
MEKQPYTSYEEGNLPRIAACAHLGWYIAKGKEILLPHQLAEGMWELFGNTMPEDLLPKYEHDWKQQHDGYIEKDIVASIYQNLGVESPGNEWQALKERKCPNILKEEEDLNARMSLVSACEHLVDYMNGGKQDMNIPKLASGISCLFGLPPTCDQSAQNLLSNKLYGAHAPVDILPSLNGGETGGSSITGTGHERAPVEKRMKHIMGRYFGGW